MPAVVSPLAVFQVVHAVMPIFVKPVIKPDHGSKSCVAVMKNCEEVSPTATRCVPRLCVPNLTSCDEEDSAVIRCDELGRSWEIRSAVKRVVAVLK